MAKRLVIAIDCDDVLIPTTQFLVRAYNMRYGTAVTLEKSHTPDDHMWGAAHDEVIARLAKLTQEDAYKRLKPGVIEKHILQQLALRHELHVVTARQESEREYTETLLGRELPGVFTSMEFLGWTGSKGEVCKAIGADILIDDNIKHLRTARECGVQHLVWFGNYPWNRVGESSDDSVVRCDDWTAVKEVIDEVEASMGVKA